MKHFQILGFLLWVSISLPAQDVYRISDGIKAGIGPYIYYLVDSTHELSADEVLQRPFARNTADIFNLSLTSVTAWLKFSLVKSSGQDILLEISEPNLEILELYEVQEGRALPLYRGGFVQPFLQRQIVHNRWIFDLELDPGENKTYLIKARSGFPLKIPVGVYSDKQFISYNARSHLGWGIYAGIMAFAFFYNLFLFISLRERMYLYYCLYVLTGSAFYLGLQGYNFQYIWPELPALNFALPVLICLMNLFVFLFTLRFLNIKPKDRFAFYGGWFFVSLYLLSALVNVFVNYGLSVVMIQMLSVFMSIYYIIVAVNALRRKVPNARYFALAWIQFIVLMVIFILTDNGVLPATQFTLHSMFIGHALEVLLLSVALAARIDFLRKDNVSKQMQIILQMEENQKIQRKANEELEQKVKQRTQEVVDQKNQAIQERNRSDELLLNILPEETAEELKNTGKAQAKRFENVTVLFTDIADFTHKSEQLTPEKLVSEVNEMFTEFDKIIEKYGIEKIKTIGDAYMAAAGLPTPDPGHATQAVNAAIEMQNFIKMRYNKNKGKGKDPFQIRLGIHSGPVVAGVVGLKKFAYDIWGFTVNVASRMEKASEVKKINISEATYQLVKDHFRCTFRGEVEVKGIGAVPMYFVEDTAPVEGPSSEKEFQQLDPPL